VRDQVRELMTPDVTVIGASANLQDLESLLLRKGVRGVPVVDDEGRIVGVVSQTDLLAWYSSIRLEGVPFYDHPDDNTYRPVEDAIQPPEDRLDARVRDVMSPLIHCIGPDKTVAEAAARMVREHIHRLVVVDDCYAVVGILSATDLLKAVPGVDAQLAAQAS